jgi:hypothetical protein
MGSTTLGMRDAAHMESSLRIVPSTREMTAYLSGQEGDSIPESASA